MTLQAAQDFLAMLFTETTTPTVGDDDWNMRTNALNLAIRKWAGTYGVRWNELYTTLADSSTGDKLTDGSSTAYDAPTDLVELTGYVQIIQSSGSYLSYQVFLPESAHLYAGRTDVNGVYVTGTEGHKQIHFFVAPDGGLVIDYPYYKSPTPLAAATDEIEMSLPEFAVYYAHALISRTQGDNDAYNASLFEANDLLDSMIAINPSLPNFQRDQIPDSTGGFGL